MKVALVTGASKGIGKACALRLARDGYTVVVNYSSSDEAAQQTLDQIKAEGGDGMVYKANVADLSQVKVMVREVLKAYGRIDVLVNNAGYGYFGAIENVTLEEARKQLEVNVFGLARMCQLVLPSMREQGSGRIINTSSIAGKTVLYFGGWYHVSKYSVEALSDALRMEVKPFGIDVSVIEPGGIKTDWGLIAADHLAESSKGTPYEQEGIREAKTMHKAYSIRLLSNPSVVTRAISRAVNSRRPRTRYRIGFGARTLVFLHALLPTRWWDAMMRKGGKLKF